MAQAAGERFLEDVASSKDAAAAGDWAEPAYQAYRILHLAFVVAPIVAGADKFLGFLCDWDRYLAPAVARVLPFGAHTFMLFAGAIEVVAGVLVLARPRVAAYVVAAWLVGIIGNLLIAGAFFDVALRDLGLALGALALGRLAQKYDRS